MKRKVYPNTLLKINGKRPKRTQRKHTRHKEKQIVDSAVTSSKDVLVGGKKSYQPRILHSVKLSFRTKVN